VLPGLFDPDLKRQWAKKHLDELTREALVIQESNKPNIATEDDLQNDRFVIRVEILHDARVFQAALVAGDFISNLRACLDHLAWQLSLIGGNPNTDICFPICERNNQDTRRYITKSTRGMPTGAVDLVKSLQPYHAADYRSTHLWRLNKLWNINKHRYITPHSVLTDWQFKTNGIERIEHKLIDGVPVLLVPLGEKDKVEFNPDCGIKLTIYDQVEGFDIDIAGLTEMYEFVADTVLPSFAPFFPTN